MTLASLRTQAYFLSLLSAELTFRRREVTAEPEKVANEMNGRRAENRERDKETD